MTSKAQSISSRRRKKHVSIQYDEQNEKKTSESKSMKKKNEALKQTSLPFSSSQVLKKKIPENWEEVWDGIEQMRKKNIAPVDTLGCSSLADRTADPKTFRYQTLISLMLSSQTKDTVTGMTMAKLREHGLTVDNILTTKEGDLDQMINKVGFHARKAGYIKKTTQILKEKYDGDIPSTVEELVKLPGVGPKMAYLTMQVAWENSVGIGVDVHVHRICNRLGWVKTKTPEKTRMELEEWLPKTHWGPINKMLVGFGQTICVPVSPKCSLCQVNHLCPSAFSKRFKKR